MSAIIGFMSSYKRQSENERNWRNRKKSKNIVKRTLGLCTTPCVCVCRLYLCIIVCGSISDI